MTNDLPAFKTMPHSTPLRTYLVEDNPLVYENLAATLQEFAAARIVGSAAGEQQAIDWLGRHRTCWDLAVVDLLLAQGTGLGVLGACRKRPSTQKIVVLSNYATTETRARCQALGADAIFDKSTGLDALIDYCTVLAAGHSHSIR